MSITYKKLALLILITFSSIFQQCNKEEDEFFDCVGDLNIDEFYFMGTHDDLYPEYYDKYYNFYYGESNFAVASFKEDRTFSINIELECDSSFSMLPICDSIDYISGYHEELMWEGIWEFEQSITTFSYDCGWLTPKTCKQNRIQGKCYLNILNSSDGILDNEIITCDLNVECAGEYSLIYWMDIDLPIYNGDRLSLQINFERNKN